jgi:hypothetical protein
MALSYISYTANSGQTNFDVTFPYLSTSHIKVQINGTDTAAYTVVTSPSTKVVLNSGATAGQIVKVYRLTPGRSASPNNVNLVNFANGSVLSEEDLDKNANQLLYLIQEADDTGGGALPYDGTILAYNASVGGSSKKIVNVTNPTNAQDAATKNYVDTKFTTDAIILNGGQWDAENLKIQNLAAPAANSDAATKAYVDTKFTTDALILSGGLWDAENLKIQNVATPQNANDAVTKAYVDALSLYGGSAIQPQSWTFTINATTDWVDQGGGVDAASRYRCTKQLAGLLSYDANTLIVSFGGVLQTPGNAYSLSNDNLSLFAAAPTAGNLTVRNFGVSRSAFAPATTSTLGAVKIGSNITVQQDGTISGPSLATVATSGSYADLTNKPTISTAGASGSYPDLINKPTLGTAASRDIPAAGNASSTQVVYGSDTRLTDARTPVAHSHAISDVTNLQTSLDAKIALAGGTFSGAPKYAADPTDANTLARKSYVDTQIVAATNPIFANPALTTSNNQALTVSIDVSTMKIGVPYIYYMRTQGLRAQGTLISPAAVQKFSFTIEAGEKLWLDDNISTATINTISTAPTEFVLTHPSQLYSTVGTKDISCSDGWYSSGILNYKHSFVVVIRMA